MLTEEIAEKLAEHKIDVSPAKLETALNILQFTSVLTEHNGQYQFLAGEVPRIFRENRNVEDSIKRLRERMRNEST